jgi:hypothetical protein
MINNFKSLKNFVPETESLYVPLFDEAGWNRDMLFSICFCLWLRRRSKTSVAKTHISFSMLFGHFATLKIFTLDLKKNVDHCLLEVNGFHVIELLSDAHYFNSQYFCEVVLPILKERMQWFRVNGKSRGSKSSWRQSFLRIPASDRLCTQRNKICINCTSP